MKKTLLTIMNLSLFILNALAINTYKFVSDDVVSGNRKISITQDTNTNNWEAGKKEEFAKDAPKEIGTRIGFIMQGTASFTSGTGWIYIANTYTKTWKSVSDTLSFSIANGVISTSGYVRLKESLSENLTADSLYVVFKMESTTPDNNAIELSFSQFETCIAAPGEILAMPMPNMTLTLGELHPRINLKDYFICDKPLEFEILNYGMQDDPTMNLVAKGVVLGDSLGFVTYNIGETGIYIMVKKKTTTTNQSNYEDLTGEINVTVKNNQMPTECTLEVTSTVKAPTCSDKRDGSIELSVTGGVEPYSFRWNNQRTSQNLYNIESGTYMVTVTDSVGCVVSTMVNAYTYFYEDFALTQSPTTCGGTDGALQVTNYTENCTYLWNTGSTESSLKDIPAGHYSVRVTNEFGCSLELETYLNDYQSESPLYIYSDYTSTTTDIDCKSNNGYIYTNTSGGTAPYTYAWENSDITTSYAGNLGVGKYTVIVTDANNCKAGYTEYIRSNSLYSYVGPNISSVTISDKTRNMLIFWQKPETDNIDYYTIYRERNDNPGVYDTLGNVSYNELSVYADEEVNPNQESWRYKLSATDFCGNESRLSFYEYKSILLNFSVTDENIINLQWDAYEGINFDRYTIFKITKDGKIKVAEIPANCSHYSEKIENGTQGYLVAVDFLDSIYVDKVDLLKVESGPFSMAMSNIAELENFSTKQVSLTPNAKVSVKQNTIIVDNPSKSNIAVYDILGQTITKNTNRVNNVTIPMEQKGIYLVIVGNEAFKVMIK